MFKESRLYTPVIGLLMLLCAVLTGITAFYDLALFLVCAAVTLIAFIGLLALMRRLNQKSAKILREIEQGVKYVGESAFMDSPVPALAVYDSNEIIWYNELCSDEIFSGLEMRGEAVSTIFPQLDLSVSSPPEGYAIEYQGKKYTAYVSTAKRENTAIAVIYLTDDSQLKYFAEEYHMTRPSVAIILIDNYDEMIQDFKETERAQLVTQIESEVSSYFSINEGFIVRIERDKFMAVIEERGIRKIIASKFDILDKVRAIAVNKHMGATLSIGVGREAATLYESEAMARQALDMCLGRGGDQVAVKNLNGYEFYGGLSKGIEKRTKVKTRIIATALSELIESGSNVIIMGHKYADLDCLGSAVGMLKAVRSMGKTACICIRRHQNAVEPLIDRLIDGGYPGEDFVSPEAAMELVNPDTLLLILDTHVPYLLESEPLYRAAKHVAVIDHHRKLVKYIDNAVIFYHEPFASSASEMVTELMQYFPSRPQLSKLEAEALLSGIMMDTKNFILQTGVRTFEAAAYLRRVGADTVQVRKLFADSMENYQRKAAIVASAEVYRSCAVAAIQEEFDDVKTIGAQVADELMIINGVKASFVISDFQGSINASARSMGEINVQVIMENLGGGGHHTMAAAQFPGETVSAIKAKVIGAIDKYYESLNTPKEEEASGQELPDSDNLA